MTGRGAAVMFTIAALVLINVGLALVIVTSVGVRTFAPLWLALVVLGVGLAAAGGAIVQWREFLRSAR